MSAPDVAALRAAAEAAITPMTCGGHRTMGSLVRCAECNTRNNAASDLVAAANPAVVLALIDRLEAAERAVARVWEVLDAGPETWTPYESRDTGWTFLEESVLDFVADLRAALDGGER